MPIKRVFFLWGVLPVILLGVFVFAASSLAKMPSSQISRESLTVMRIHVYIGKENNNDAAGVKRQALMQAQREAFQTISDRFGGSSEVPEDNIIMSFVNDYEIRGEQSYPTKYEANFNVRFKPTVLEYINQKKGGGNNPQN
ncbi:MAG: hypothetical protein V1721_02715 [Pseudomonadota bacterium]